MIERAGNFIAKKIVVVTGGFDPIHSGHIKYLTAAKELGDHLVVGVNSDEWLTRKKGAAFLNQYERETIVGSLNMVDSVYPISKEEDLDGSVCNWLEKIKSLFANDKIIFANGGDRTISTTPEQLLFQNDNQIEFQYGIGGYDKMNSSSQILKQWNNKKITRSWGYWNEIFDHTSIKVKELVIKPGESLSNQKHFLRHEHWYVLSGSLLLTIETDFKKIIHLQTNDMYSINKEVWHLATNISNQPCHILEIQQGEKCIEEDIVRR